MSNVVIQLVGCPTREVIASALVPEVSVNECWWVAGSCSGASGYSPSQIATDVWRLRFSNHDIRTLGDLVVGFTIGTHLKIQWYTWAGLECWDYPQSNPSGGDIVSHLRRKFGVGLGPVSPEHVFPPLPRKFRMGFGLPEE